MEQKSMTALVSAFSRAFHSRVNTVHVFNDYLAAEILSADEYEQISESMIKGIQFFNPGFSGNKDGALRWIVDNQLSPSPLGRAAFIEESLANCVNKGTRQYVILGAGYDSFAYRKPAWADSLKVFEVDHPLTSRDKYLRLEKAHIEVPPNTYYVQTDFTNPKWENDLIANTSFDCTEQSFVSLSGLTYYLSKKDFCSMLDKLVPLLPDGSYVAFDYPDQDSYTDKCGPRAKKQAMLAGGAKEKMLASYSLAEIELLLKYYGFSIISNLTPDRITKEYFSKYNRANPHNTMSAFDNVNYCLATVSQSPQLRVYK